MTRRVTRNMSDIPQDELESMMIAYGRRQARTVRTARAFLRRIGVPVDRRGIIDESKFAAM